MRLVSILIRNGKVIEIYWAYIISLFEFLRNTIMLPKKVRDRRTCIFNTELAKKYPFIINVPNRTPSDVRCTVCTAEFSVANSGRSDIEKHHKQF